MRVEVNQVEESLIVLFHELKFLFSIRDKAISKNKTIGTKDIQKETKRHHGWNQETLRLNHLTMINTQSNGNETGCRRRN